MTAKLFKRSRFATWSLAASTSIALLGLSPSAHADDVSPSGKGITGGALLGAEVVMLTEAAAGVKSGWLYLAGGVVGAGAAGYAGYQIEQNADPQVSLYLLAGGMALIIPTTVAVLQASSYRPPEDYTEDHPVSSAPAADPPRPAMPASAAPPEPAPAAPPSSAPPSSSLHLHYHWRDAKLTLPAGLMDLDEGAMHVGVPAIEVRPMYSMQEIARYGVAQQSELRVPVFAATF